MGIHEEIKKLKASQSRGVIDSEGFAFRNCWLTLQHFEDCTGQCPLEEVGPEQTLSLKRLDPECMTCYTSTSEHEHGGLSRECCLFYQSCQSKINS
jgi:hypothetical protein